MRKVSQLLTKKSPFFAPALLTLVTMTTLVGIFVVFFSRAEAGTYHIPATIPANCSEGSRDVSPDIIAWIASVPDNSTLVFGQNACYHFENENPDDLKIYQDRFGNTITAKRPFVIDNRTGLTFEGNGATFKSFKRGDITGCCQDGFPYYSQRRHWHFKGGRDLTLRNMRVEGTNTKDDVGNGGRPGFGSYLVAFEFEHAFTFTDGAEDVTLENLSAYAIWGDGLYLGGGAGGVTKNVVAKDLVIDLNGRQGVALSGADGVVLDNIRILHSRRSGFDLEPPPGYDRNIEIKNSYSNHIGTGVAALGKNDVSNIYIHHNVFDGPGGVINAAGLPDQIRRDWRVHDNISLFSMGSPGPSPKFKYIDNLDIRRNIFRISPNQSREALGLTEMGGEVNIYDNDTLGACAPYTLISNTRNAVINTGNNVISDCEGDDHFPQITLTAPVDGASLSGIVNFIAAASDNLQVSKVEFYVDTKLIQTDTIAPYSFNWDTSLVANGTHYLTVRVYDNEGHISSSPPPIRKVVVANGNPPPPPPPTQRADLNGDGKVNVFDLSILLSKWGSSDPNADINDDGVVNVFDLSVMLGEWTP